MCWGSRGLLPLPSSPPSGAAPGAGGTDLIGLGRWSADWHFLPGSGDPTGRSARRLPGGERRCLPPPRRKLFGPPQKRHGSSGKFGSRVPLPGAQAARFGSRAIALSPHIPGGGEGRGGGEPWQAPLEGRQSEVPLAAAHASRGGGESAEETPAPQPSKQEEETEICSSPATSAPNRRVLHRARPAARHAAPTPSPPRTINPQRAGVGRAGPGRAGWPYSRLSSSPPIPTLSAISFPTRDSSLASAGSRARWISRLPRRGGGIPPPPVLFVCLHSEGP